MERDIKKIFIAYFWSPLWSMVGTFLLDILEQDKASELLVISHKKNVENRHGDLARSTLFQ